MNQHTFQKLEFQAIRDALAACCSSQLGRNLAEGLAPSAKVGLVRQWLQQVDEMRIVAEEVSYPPMGGVFDVREEVRACSQPTPIEGDGLARIAETLEATATIRAWFTKIESHAPELAHYVERIEDFSDLAAAINEAVDPKGRLRDHASPKLHAIRQSIDDARSRLRGITDRLLKQSQVRNMLQYGGATFHDDRMVLPLKAEYRGRIKGIVHRSSDSGATIFVEPAESVELNNRIMSLRDSEAKEITRILRELCRRVHCRGKYIIETLRSLGVLDLIAAKARYGKSRRCVCPEMNDDGLLDVHEARHPVLLELMEYERDEHGRVVERVNPPARVVPIDARLGDDFDILIITGPNTGGKTVAIKTIGLLALMTQCGVPIPAASGSRMPVFNQIHIDIGDEQNLQQSLSTFSSHLSNLLAVLEHSGSKSLVLIDEMGAGTDPDEGAAIGQSVIAELLRLQSRAVITTHLSALKAVAFTKDRVDNASVEFDVESLQPTYKLRLGEPGNSNALIIAKRLGMPARLVEYARQQLDDRNRILHKAIRGTLSSRRQAERARKQAVEATQEAKRQEEEANRRQAELERSQAAFERWTSWINDLKPGDDVHIKSLRRDAQVVRMQLHKQMVLVTAGMMDIEVPLKDIDPPA